MGRATELCIRSLDHGPRGVCNSDAPKDWGSRTEVTAPFMLNSFPYGPKGSHKRLVLRSNEGRILEIIVAFYADRSALY